MTEDTDQYEAAVDHLLGLMVMLHEKPAAFDREELPNWLLLLANERERQGDFGAARLLDAWAERLAEKLGKVSEG
ncbi:hypothetical protein [Paracoccus sp. (in: a-proteobacteria)]|uniref:hypothetical protein n=1 Tax=Paracoccus sp. TaxID=267 RepID=UPI002AFFADF9|nr:hypothetical protein [Paracoccus sp. (in: a-proteobacteria)]